MRFRIVSVGRIRDRHIALKIEEYLRRVRREVLCEHTIVRDSNPHTEGRRILSTLAASPRSRTFALGEEGRSLTSRQFAELLAESARETVFIVGGPDGLSQEVKDAADDVLSLSVMTLPHELAILVLTEQVFRALTILGNRKYHR